MDKDYEVRIKWVDGVRNEEVLKRVKVGRTLLYTESEAGLMYN